MAGLLTPSHFTQVEEKSLEEETRINVLVPPSSYEKIPQAATQGKVEAIQPKTVTYLQSENSELRAKVDKLLEEKKFLYRSKDEEISQRSTREQSMASELRAAHRKIGDLSQENEILQYEVQDKDNVSGMVLKLRKEINRAKEKGVAKEKAMNEKIEEYGRIIKCLKEDIYANEMSKLGYIEEFSKLKETCLKQDIYRKNIVQSNCELQKIIDSQQMKFDEMFKDQENERNGNFEKLMKEHKMTCKRMDEISEQNDRMKEENMRLGEVNRKNVDRKEELENKNMELKDKIERMENEMIKEKERSACLENEVAVKDSQITELQDMLVMKENDVTRSESEQKNSIVKLQRDYEENVCKLEETIQCKEEENVREQKIFAEKLKEKEDEISKLLQSVEQLRCYIGEVRPNQESEKLTETNKNLSCTIEVLTEENTTLHSTVKLLNVRLSAILEIVALQENELSLGGEGSGGLLRKWREKVFALMVQLRCQKIVEENEKREENRKLDQLKGEVESLRRECSVLEHKLTDKEAALELESNLGQKHAEEVKKLKQNVKVLREQQSHLVSEIRGVHDTALEIQKTVMQCLETMNKCVGKVTSFRERVKFAASRIHFITEYLSQRDCGRKTGAGTQVDSVLQAENDDAHLKDEVEKLLRERDLLLSEAKKHNNILEERTSLITEHYENIVKEKNERIRQFEASEGELTESLGTLKTVLETKTQELEEALETVDELKLVLTKEKTALEKAHRDALEKQRLGNIEDMRVIEGQLNDVRREHGKAVMALKNAERQVAQEKDLASKMVGNIEREFSAKLARCEKQLNDVEKERNLLMVNIREDKRNVRTSRAPPVQGTAEHNTKTKSGFLSSSKQGNCSLGKSQQSDVASRTGVSLGDNQGNTGEKGSSMDPSEALSTLKEIKLLSEQIIKIQENSASESEK